MRTQQRLKKRYLHWQLLCIKILGHQENSGFDKQLSHQFTFYSLILVKYGCKFYFILTIRISKNIIYSQLKTSEYLFRVAFLLRPITVNNILW